MSELRSYREISKINWSTKDKDISLDQINTGSLLRIADATELMATNFTQLQNDRDWYKRKYHEETKENQELRRKIAALKGVITKMKKSKNV